MSELGTATLTTERADRTSSVTHRAVCLTDTPTGSNGLTLTALFCHGGITRRWDRKNATDSPPKPSQPFLRDERCLRNPYAFDQPDGYAPPTSSQPVGKAENGSAVTACLFAITGLEASERNAEPLAESISSASCSQLGLCFKSPLTLDIFL